MTKMNVAFRFATLLGATALALIVAATGATLAHSGQSGNHRTAVTADHGWGPAATSGSLRGI